MSVLIGAKLGGVRTGLQANVRAHRGDDLNDNAFLRGDAGGAISRRRDPRPPSRLVVFGEA